MQEQTMRMTEGSIYKKIVLFALPIFWGSVFQQLYNVVDSVIVGNFVGKEALAAISSTGPLIFLIIGLVSGVFSGAGVVISRYFGSGDTQEVKRAIHTTVAFGIVASIGITVLGTVLAPQILEMMGTPIEVFENAIVYIRIYFLGVSTVIMYNTANGIFQAVGDSKRPLYFLITASLINIVLDIVFVLGCQMGIAGAACATVIAQGTSAYLAFRHLVKTQEIYQVTLKKAKLHRDILADILKMGVPSGIQNSVISFANVFVQASINKFGAVAVAGTGAYLKIEGFVFIPILSFVMAMTVFISQNLGAGDYERAKKGTYFGLGVCAGLAELVGGMFYIAAPHLITLFTNDPEVVTYGVTQARTVSLFYCLLAFSHCMAGIMRGAGKAVVPMVVMLVFWCLVRVTYITVATYLLPDIRVIYWAYPLTWSLSSITFAIYYLKADWLRKKPLEMRF